MLYFIENYPESFREMGEQKKSEGKQSYSSYLESQYARLGFFLTASSFLVVAFVTLVIVDKEAIITLLTHAVAALGSFIVALHVFMNLWVWLQAWWKRVSSIQQHVQGELKRFNADGDLTDGLEKLAEFLVGVSKAWEEASQEQRSKLARCLFQEV